MQSYNVINNEQEKQFEVHDEGDLAFLQYRFHHDELYLMHTYVPEKLSGKGIASGLASYALNWATDNGKKVKVYCPFVAAFLKRHPEYDYLIDKSV
ncbi:MAG: N-acetyltransferase [Bacteroidetes bacterium]|nr:N-acetyltransferase [Bacteroidota bacterium]MBS1933460.1 N-acetyltransferase [Bacteroidota bacterium]